MQEANLYRFLIGTNTLQTFFSAISSNPHKKKEIMTTIAQAIGQEFESKGRQQGMQTKALDIAKNMLSKLHLDVETVAQATGLSQEELMKLQADTNQ